MGKKGKHALMSESALHKSLACKNYSSSASREPCSSFLGEQGFGKVCKGFRTLELFEQYDVQF
jgi:hypothetical protein